MLLKVLTILPLWLITSSGNTVATAKEKDYVPLSLLTTDSKPSQNEVYKRMGDMLFTEETWMMWNSPTRGIIRTDKRWPKDSNGNVIVPYEIASTYPGSKDFLTEGQLQWSSKTCIKFIEKSDPALPAGLGDNWVKYDDGTDCSSFVGMTGGGQKISLKNDCNSAKTVAHELGHALGFGHEHQRSDRDDYLVVIDSNISPDSMDNFAKETNYDNYGAPYNYMANLHYAWNAGGIDQNKPVMVPKDPSLRYLVTGEYPVSHYEALAANIAFGCIDLWKSKCGTSIPNCLNYGYIGPDCKCVCPDGTSGDNCGTMTAKSLPAYPPSPCGGKITSAGSYSVPDMGGARKPGLECIWYIEAPVCTNAQVTMSSFNVLSDATCSNNKFQVGSKNLYVPEIGPLCGDSSVVPDGTKYTGSPSLALYYTSNTDYQTDAGGFKFQVDFIPQSTCTTTTTTAKPAVTTTKPTVTTKRSSNLVTTTAAPSLEKCKLLKVDNKTFIWTSPGYPKRVPANSRCTLLLTTKTGGFNVSLNYFRVTADQTCENAHVYFAPSYPMRKFCNEKSGTKFQIHRHFAAFQYQSNPLYATTGFNITISTF